jgi:tripartite-type tricarboxylate transporter receptor subunit TctC
VVVDNRGGASGVIAMEVAAQAVPDGYTFLIIPGSLISSAAAQKKLSFDVRKAYAPVTQLTTVAYVLMINAGLKPETLQDFVAYAKARPNALSYGSSGVGGIGHLASALFCELSGVRMTHVPYKGSGPALVDMIAGQVQMGFTATISGMPHVRAGRLKALGISSAKRVHAFPDIPTIAEGGVSGFDLINWYGLFAPAAAPRPIVNALHRMVVQELTAADVQAAFSKDGAEATSSPSPEAFAALLAKEIASWERFVKLPGFAEHLR